MPKVLHRHFLSQLRTHNFKHADGCTRITRTLKLFGINFRLITLTLTPLSVVEINIKSVSGETVFRPFPRKVQVSRDMKIGFGKRGLLEKGSFQKSPFSRDSREFRDSRDFRGPPDCGKQRRIRPFSR